MQLRDRPAPGTAGARLRFGRFGQDGAALVEFSIVVGFLLLLLYGIIAFGLALAVKESVTEAASDGARAAVPAATGSGAEAAAQGAVDNAIAWLGKCGDGAFTCSTSVLSPGTSGCTNSANSCIQVEVSYDWKDHAVIPNLPGIGLLLPNTIPAQAVSELANVT